MKYIEIDLVDVAMRKAAAISYFEELRNTLPGDASYDGTATGHVQSRRYCLCGGDLCNLDSIIEALRRVGIDYSMPTLMVFECVLSYLEAEVSVAVLAWAAKRFGSAAVIIYDPMKPSDPFGQQMMLNLEARGCPLLGIRAVPSPESQVRRLLDAGWSRAEALSMKEVHTLFIDPADRLRAEKIEPLDEFEEWNMLMEHYCLVIGVYDQEHILDNLKLA